MTDSPVAFNRTERTLAYMIASCAGLSVLAIVALLVAGSAGIDTSGTDIWLTVKVLPLIGLPIALGLIVVLLVLSVVRRRRLARDAGR